ncbi:MAG: FAD-binding monooxygenase [Nonomuraea muscovyensis]|uniref:2-polyprenyl-6-methoxyphenol hydroxylase-like FAD-dependent oxidoreductase n=1 Tax=Nonomuraea muscovyensis TaxID=1124761 RepID=A0A7X0BYK6_9ACTN|nr:NAD(P)/FAD-dependent oxidoreductase [Nonomuraea muscovyensis]MBB6345297.1 2-polyprenyl-6-methoxyphenol hydroxylase-like FAD-dependent oxidoreductase [Nonomuraea muscovyensis]MDF2705083.1 FAD-binding monooxygenase [Nonomuraea muscovyensis]
MTYDIAIIGGGIGGLCLAQGLRRAGRTVTVYERDRTPADRLQGYRVHIDPQGARALHDCLPPRLWRAFLDTTGRGGQDFGFLTERLELLTLLETRPAADPADDHHSVSRITLRQVLLSGLEDTVRFGSTFERYERRPDGRTELFFADGSSATADVVVAADGGNSRVRRQYLPHAERVDTGITTVAGKFPLTAETRRLVSPRLTAGPNSVIPPAGMGMFCAPHDVDGRTPVAGIGVTEQAGALMDNTAGYVLWAVGAAEGRFPSDVSDMTGEQLKATVARMIGSWHPDLRELVARSDPESVSLLPIRTSVPIEPWQPTAVTLIGDAIHSMTPMRGIGANIALRDARLLSGALTSGLDPITAISRYEAEMRRYGFAAVRDSLQAAHQFVGGNRLARTGFKTFLRATRRFPSLKARAFA